MDLRSIRSPEGEKMKESQLEIFSRINKFKKSIESKGYHVLKLYIEDDLFLKLNPIENGCVKPNKCCGLEYEIVKNDNGALVMSAAKNFILFEE